MPTFTVHDGITDLMHKYDGFILDQFGVMVRKTLRAPLLLRDRS